MELDIGQSIAIMAGSALLMPQTVSVLLCGRQADFVAWLIIDLIFASAIKVLLF